MGSTEQPLNPILTAPQNNGLKKKKKIKTTAIWGQIFSNFNLNTAALKKGKRNCLNAKVCKHIFTLRFKNASLNGTCISTAALNDAACNRSCKCIEYELPQTSLSWLYG